MPPSGLAGTKSKYTLYGRNLPGGTPSDEQTASGTPLERIDVEIKLPENPAAVQRFGGDTFAEPTEFGLDAFAYRLQTPHGETNPVNIYFATAPVVSEKEPNDTPQQAQKISLPCEVVGQFNPKGDQDWYQFDAHKGDAWTIEVYSQRLGLSTDPYLLVQRVNHAAGGREEMVDVAESDDPSPEKRHERHETFLNLEFDDPLVRFVAPEDGTYRILVRDLYGQSRGSPEYVYRLAIHRPAPDFRTLLLQEVPGDYDGSDRMNLWSAVVHQGRSTAVTVMAQREDGFAGEIQLSVEGLPAGIICSGATIGPGADFATLVFAAGDKVAPWNGSLRVVAKARIGDRDVVHDARTVTSVWPVQQTSQETPQFRLASSFALSAAGNSMPQIKIDFGDGKPLETAPGGNLKIPVKLERGEKSKGRVRFRLAGACRGMNVPELEIPAEANEGTLQLNVNSQLPAGKYTLPLRAYAGLNCRNNPEAADAATAMFKSIEKGATDLASTARKADETKKMAEQVAANAEAAVRQALEGVAAANRTLHETEDRAKAAADALVPLETASADAAARLQAAEAAQSKADKSVADSKESDKNPAATKGAGRRGRGCPQGSRREPSGRRSSRCRARRFPSCPDAAHRRRSGKSLGGKEIDRCIRSCKDIFRSAHGRPNHGHRCGRQEPCRRHRKSGRRPTSPTSQRGRAAARLHIGVLFQPAGPRCRRRADFHVDPRAAETGAAGRKSRCAAAVRAAVRLCGHCLCRLGLATKCVRPACGRPHCSIRSDKRNARHRARFANQAGRIQRDRSRSDEFQRSSLAVGSAGRDRSSAAREEESSP